MYRRYAIQFHKKQLEFVDCNNMLERIKKARALPSGISHLGVQEYIVSSSELGEKKYLRIKY